MQILDNLEKIQNEISVAAKRAGRDAKDIILLGATKTVDPEIIQKAVDGGLSYIGENRVQELCDKYDKVHRAHWHFIGHLQTNKVKYIIDKAELIHAVDSAHLLDEIEKQAKKHNLVSRVLIEVNASGEESKFGTGFDAVLPLIEANEKNTNVQIAGLMTIGPHTDNTDEIRTAFRNMNALYEKIGVSSYHNTKMQYLSMGMSGDYTVAIEEGANIVRIGSAIFGHRKWR
ncbi:MAG: YggS family pyridoxal phosphate-dependent enzyme [Clostridia bacterium]|nr:YggS family pyridoxal phosphate-dependent enzyme [Clostridia bacterium]